MDIHALLGRLRAVFRRKPAQLGEAINRWLSGFNLKGSPGQESVILHHGPTSAETDYDFPKTITREELLSSAISQDASLFFTILPLEIRRMIYREVWSAYLKPRRLSPSSPGSDLRLHIYANGSDRVNLGHTTCEVHPGEPTQEDAWVTSPWPFENHGSNPSRMPPRWFWFAWVMRLNWGKHWQCQHAIQKRWDPMTGYAEPAEKAPFLAVFLTCKEMYLEAIVSFFETVTPIFTFSVDAHRFFIRRPHSFLGELKSLELSFNNPNDHLYLTRRYQSSTSVRSAATGDDSNDSLLQSILALPDPNAGPDEDESAGNDGLFGQNMWINVLQGVRAACPKLKDLTITIGGKISRDAVLAGFGWIDRDEGYDSEPGSDERDGDDALSGERWELPGKMAITFKPNGETYIQEKGRLVLQAPEQVTV